MDVKVLMPFVLLLVMVGMILGVGVLTFEKFKDAAFNTDTITNESITWTYNGTITLAHGNITTFTSIINSSSAVVNSANYTIGLTPGNITVTNYSDTAAPPDMDGMGRTCLQGATCYANYKYKNYDTKTSSTMNSMVSAVSPISSTWLPLIVTILVLAIILGLVINSFTGRSRSY